MKIPNFSGLTKIAGIGKAFVMANRPELLFGASVVSTLGAVGLAAKGGYESGQKVLRIEYHEFFEEGPKPSINLTNVEKAQITWKNYVPAAIATVGAVGSTTGLHLVHVKEKKALATAGLAALNEAREELQVFKERAIELIEDDSKTDEEKKEELVEAAKADVALEARYIVRDAWSGREIYSNKQLIEDAVNEFNNILNGQGDCELNTFYSFAGFDSLPEGTNVGFSGELVALSWDTDARRDGEPVSVFTFRSKPTESYRDAHR